MDEDRRRDGEERDAPIERQIAEHQVELHGEERADEAEHREHSGASGDRERHDRKERQAEVADRVDRVANDDPVDVGELLRIEIEIARARVVIRQVEVVVEHQALRDDEVMRLVGRRGHDGAVVRQDDETDREQRRAE